MGAVIAPKKSFCYTTQPAARKWLSNHVWRVINSKIPVILHARDLGGQINTLHRGVGTVLNDRIIKALACLRRIRYRPHTPAEKAMFIRTKILPMALYGIEGAAPREQLLRALQAAIVEVIGPNSARRCNALVFETCSAGDDLDPHIAQFTRRITLFRRMWSMYPSCRDMVNDLYNCYHKADYIGTNTDPEFLKQAKPAPPPPLKE